MKSKMKSAFAIIAVALMIMVAVVPMVSVFTEDSSAAPKTEVDPSTDNNIITLNVTVTGNPTAIVKIAYGSYSFTTTASSGSAPFSIREASVASLKISVVDANGVEDSTYPAVTMTNLVAGKTYGAALKSGYSSQSVKFQFANDIDLAESNIGKAATITSTYTVYSDSAGTMQISTGQFVVNSDYTATFMVPAGTTGSVYVKVNSFSCSTVGAITFDPTALTTVTIGTTAVALKAQQSLVIVNPATAMNTDVMITAFKQTTTPSSGSPTTIQFTPIKNTMNNAAVTDKTARFIGIVPASTAGTNTYAMDLSADGSSASDVVVTVTINTGASSYTLPTTSFYGTVKMNTSYAQAGTLAAKVFDNSSTPVEMGSISATVDDKGNFFKFVTLTGTGTPSSLKNITLTSVGTAYSVSDASWSTSGYTLSVVPTGYSLVSGTFKLDVSTDTSIVDKQLTVTGAKTFGSLFTTSTGFAFMAETGKNIIISAANAELYGDVSIVPNTTGSTGKEIKMKAQALTLKVADALGNALTGATVKLTDGVTDIATFGAGTPAGTYTASIRGDLVATNYKVYIDGPAGYTYVNSAKETATAFVEGSTYKALESTYSIELYKSNGVTTAGATADTDYKLYKAKAYKNSLGTFVYNYDETADKITINTSGNKFVAKASAIAVKESDIGTTPVDVVVMVKETGLDAKGMFKNVYLINADSMGMVSIVASKDMLAAKLVRNDGVTGVPKIKVELYKGDVSTSSNLVDTTFTQADGTFTLYSDLAITSSYKVKFTENSGYEFESTGYAATTSAGKVAKFMPKTSPYEMSFYDADGTMIDVSSVSTVDIGGVTTFETEDDYIYISANWTLATGMISIKLKNSSDKEIRSFEKHTLTAEELATGKITVKSLQKNYTFTVTDADGNVINGAYVNLYKYVGDYPVYKGQKTTNSMGKLTVAFPYIGDEDGATYGYVVNKGDYAFSTDVSKITDVKIDVKSTSVEKTVNLQDAAGVALKETPSTISIYANGNSGPNVVEKADGYFTYIATKDVKYTYTIAMNTSSNYSFAAKATDTDGVVKAKEQTVYGTVTDAGGLYFGKEVTIKAYNASGSVIGTEGKQKDTDMSYSMIVEKSKVSYYLAEDVTVDGTVKFTFEKSKTADIKAKETFVPIGYKTFNGKEIDSTYSISEVSVMNDLGNLTNNTIVDVNDIPGIVVDTTNVSYYAVKFTSTMSDDYFDEGTYMSNDGVFVSDMALYEGKLGDVSSTTSVEYAVYDGNAVIERGPVTDITAGKYTVKVDRTLGNKVVITQTVTSGGKTSTYTAVMDDKATYNDLKMVVTEPDLKAMIVTNGHVGYVISSDKTKVYLSADESYTMDATSSTGSKLVEKFVFDGWYVNGERVSGKLVYTVDNMESNIVLANYVSDGYYEMDKPASGNSGVSPTVLVIGIAAVIIALIAVVYVVVQKKE